MDLVKPACEGEVLDDRNGKKKKCGHAHARVTHTQTHVTTHTRIDDVKFINTRTTDDTPAAFPRFMELISELFPTFGYPTTPTVMDFLDPRDLA